jgi:endonuclease III
VYGQHPHELLPLETSLPQELQYPARDHYRTVLTMILSVRMADIRLTRALGKLFSQYPDFPSLQRLSPQQIKRVLKNAGVVLNNPGHNGNGARLWGFIKLYFGPWNKKITEQNIQTLQSLRVRGYGDKVVRLLQAYCFGNKNVLPLDTPAFDCLRKCGFYRDSNIYNARLDVEKKLGGLTGVSLIDFHELLRFRGQAGRTHSKKLTDKQKKIIIGWNAWRLLPSVHREKLTGDWIYRNLVQSKDLSVELLDYVRSICGHQARQAGAG